MSFAINFIRRPSQSEAAQQPTRNAEIPDFDPNQPLSQAFQAAWRYADRCLQTGDTQTAKLVLEKIFPTPNT